MYRRAQKQLFLPVAENLSVVRNAPLFEQSCTAYLVDTVDLQLSLKILQESSKVPAQFNKNEHHHVRPGAIDWCRVWRGNRALFARMDFLAKNSIESILGLSFRHTAVAKCCIDRPERCLCSAQFQIVLKQALGL